MQGVNPFLPSWEYIPDGEPHVFGDRLYLYGSHDRFGGTAYCENDYVCWSAPMDDLTCWQYEGVIFRREQAPNADKGYLYAPDVIQGPDGRYYLYYAISGDTTVSVAVCDTPAGAYAFLGHVRHADGVPFGCKRGDVNNFDPGLLRDDDGRIYLYTGFAPKGARLRAKKEADGLLCNGGYVVELAADMLTVVSSPVQTIPGLVPAAGTPFDGHAYFEASSPRKIDGVYYLLWSSVLSHELCYATSNSPMGPFTFGGTIISIADLGYHGNQTPQNYTGNTHGGLVEVQGQWYVFYHRHTNRCAFSRQACAEPVTLLPDGSIPQCEITSSGLYGKPLPGVGCYEARIACNLSSAAGTFDCGKPEQPEGHPYFTQSSEDREDNGDQYIANMQDGSWAGFKYFAFENARRISITARGNGVGSMIVSNSRGAAPCAVIPLSPAQEWSAFTADFHCTPGVHPLFFTYEGSGAVDFLSFSLSQD